MKTASRAILVILLLLTLAFVGCNSDGGQKSSDREQNNTETPSKNRLCDTMGYPDQSVSPRFDWINSSDEDDMETEYDNFSITLDKDESEQNQHIKISIQNNNGKPFGYYAVPYVEKYDGNTQKWERLTYAPDEVYYSGNWYTGLGKTNIDFDPYFMVEPMTSGEYRFIIFAGGKEFYSPSFNVI